MNPLGAILVGRVGGALPILQLPEWVGGFLVALFVGVALVVGLWVNFVRARELYGNDDWAGPPVNCEACGAANDQGVDECEYCGEPMGGPTER